MPVVPASTVRKQIAQRHPDPVYLIVGDDEAEMSRLSAEISSLIEDELRAFNSERFYAGERGVTPAAIVARQARTLPMMSNAGRDRPEGGKDAQASTPRQGGRRGTVRRRRGRGRPSSTCSTPMSAIRCRRRRWCCGDDVDPRGSCRRFRSEPQSSSAGACGSPGKAVSTCVRWRG